MASRKTPKQPLNRDRIIDAAKAIIDQDGVEGLSMRKLGARLKVEAMTLYHYFASKDSLLDVLVERIVLEAATAPETRSGNWRQKLEGFARRFYATLISCPHILPLLATRPVRSTKAMAQFASALEGLVAEGFSASEGYYILNTLALMALGHALAAVGQSSRNDDAADEAARVAYLAHLAKLFENPQALVAQHERQFEFALQMFLDGLTLQREHAMHGGTG